MCAGSPQGSCFMLRSGLVSTPTLTWDKSPLSHPKSCVLNMAGLGIEVSELDLGTGTTAVGSHKPAFRRAGRSLGGQPTRGMAGWKFQEHLETNQSRSDPSAVGTAQGLGKLGMWDAVGQWCEGLEQLLEGWRRTAGV